MCGEDGLANCTKFCLCSSNFFIAIFGIVLVVIAVMTKGSDALAPIIEKIPAIGTLLSYVIALGVLTFIVAAVGCVGSMLKQKYILMAYAALLGLMILTKFIIAIVLFVKINKEKSDDVIDMLQDRFDENPQIFMGIESMLKCCGVTGIETYTKKGMRPSLTCCQISGIASVLGGCTAENAQPGCDTVVWPQLKPSYKFLAIILLVMSFFELFMLAFALLLLRSAMQD